MKPHEVYQRTLKNNLLDPSNPGPLDNVLNTDSKKIINKKIEQILNDSRDRHKKEKILKILSKIDDSYAKEIFRELNKKWGLEIKLQELCQDFDKEILDNKIKEKSKPRSKTKKSDNKLLLGSEIGLITSILIMFGSLILENTLGVFLAWILITASSIVLVSRLNTKK